ncbi:MAG: 1-deoxy-D-xylulose-5-phosphate reductoisomerase [Candidatus Aminicenantes bacterium RBG_16_63_16]|nr:MAG: 1-deoxy-D-xylulose-5-phosphate reductoisomerase [Candidatus Aminicenantes bacterium RBG_16_63_16]
MKKIAVLGSTGSIGVNTLAVADRLRERFRVVGLAAGANTSLLADQVRRFNPEIVSVKTKEAADSLRRSLSGPGLRIVHGKEGAEEVAGSPDNDVVVSAITGFEGLRPTLAAVRAGARIALANKESLVVAGALLQAEAASSGAEIIPVDSEHSGVFQCLAKEPRAGVGRVILTASGGPFFRTPISEIGSKPVEEALRHPRWKMGKKVTIDSATLMNKGLELIEARWLFGLAPAQLGVLIHPQSIVHSLVEMRDGSVLAQLSVTDMKIPIQFALTYPEREASPLPLLDLGRVRELEFYDVDEDRYPLMNLARRALETGRSLPVALNAANEVAVAAFLEGRISFSGIAGWVTRVLEGHRVVNVDTLEEISQVDREVRAQTSHLIGERS